MSNKNRDFLLDHISGKKEEDKQVPVHVIAIEDDEQRFVATIQVEQGIIIRVPEFIRVSRPEGYESIWTHKHYHDFDVYTLTEEEIKAMPPAVGNYSHQIAKTLGIYSGSIFVKDYQATDLDKVLEQERAESQDADLAMGLATYLYWRKLANLDYNEDEIETNWRRYCEYRRKYGLKEEKIFPAFKVGN